jgi:hypothetical protein
MRLRFQESANRPQDGGVLHSLVLDLFSNPAGYRGLKSERTFSPAKPRFLTEIVQ